MYGLVHVHKNMIPLEKYKCRWEEIIKHRSALEFLLSFQAGSSQRCSTDLRKLESSGAPV